MDWIGLDWIQSLTKRSRDRLSRDCPPIPPLPLIPFGLADVIVEDVVDVDVDVDDVVVNAGLVVFIDIPL